MPTKETLIAQLNKALEWEYAAAVQYVQHAAIISGPQYDSIAKELIVHSNEEMAHAVTVSNAITDLGGTPSIEVEKRDVSEDAKEMLMQDLKGEELAIKMYKEIVKTAEEMQEYGIRRLMEDILVQEEEHKRDLLSSLGK